MIVNCIRNLGTQRGEMVFRSEKLVLAAYHRVGVDTGGKYMETRGIVRESYDLWSLESL